MLALIDSMFWQVTLWTLLGCIVINVFVQIQMYFLDPNREQFIKDWYETFDANIAARYKDGQLNWRYRDLHEHWGGELAETDLRGD